VGEQVRRHHRDDEAGLVQRGAEALDPLVALAGVAAERDDVVVVERDAVGAHVGELVHRLDHVDLGAGGVTEGVAGLPADRPETEGELVLASGLGRGHEGPPEGSGICFALEQ
jgi:hypothetical protein